MKGKGRGVERSRRRVVDGLAPDEELIAALEGVEGHEAGLVDLPLEVLGPPPGVEGRGLGLWRPRDGSSRSACCESVLQPGPARTLIASRFHNSAHG
jgi:hypothetical protein